MSRGDPEARQRLTPVVFGVRGETVPVDNYDPVVNPGPNTFSGLVHSLAGQRRYR